MPASAKIEGNCVLVWNKELKNPWLCVLVTNAAMRNLFSKEGSRVNTFRTDNWDDVKTINQ